MVLDGGVVNATPRLLSPLERSGTHCTGGWVGPGWGAGLRGCGKSPPPTSTEFRSADHSARSEPLYRLSYPVPQYSG